MKINNLLTDQQIFLSRLNNLAKTPKSLYVIGNLPETEVISVAIVGTRRPTAYGKTVTEQISHALASKGVYIISGMALGVDAIAHKSAIDAGGHTIAVLPSGVDRPYPRTNTELARRILTSGGALISEYENGHTPRAYDFLYRNRLVSGLADVVIVTEANIRSGTLSTVSHALEQGRAVYAVPGPITSPLSAGCNKLIAQGATPITSVEELVDQLGLSQSLAEKILGDTPLEQYIIDQLHAGENDGETMLANANSAPEEFMGALTMLEIKGVVKPLGANKWRL